MKFNLNKLLWNKQLPILKKTKMVCTIGPTSDDVNVVTQLLKNGLNVCRINFSHDDHEVHYKKLLRIREAIVNTNSMGNVAIMLDTKGPEIRTGFLATPKIELKAGQSIMLTSDYSIKGNPELLALSYEHLYDSVFVNGKILIADGNLSLQVIEKDPKTRTVVAKVLNDFVLGEKKNVNLPGVKVQIPVISEKDRIDLIDFGLKHDVDMIALSFTRTANCIHMCKEVLGEKGKHIKIIPKIENQEGLENLDEILKVSDGVMIARGDLGMEMEPAKLFIAQKYITQKAREHKKPVIVATQMLESMTQNARPTRAEITDVGQAVFDFNDCTMLSGETGNGKFPVVSVSTMSDICKEAENHLDYEAEFNSRFNKADYSNAKENALAIAAVKLAFSSESNCIICLSENDLLVREISALRPNAFIFYPHSNERLLRSLQVHFGVITVKTAQPKNPKESNESIQAVKNRIKDLKMDQNFKSIVVVNGDSNEILLMNFE
jgi:pyruvate kinase